MLAGSSDFTLKSHGRARKDCRIQGETLAHLSHDRSRRVLSRF